eukprot:TRINITY_DN2807_c0_g2_i13.p1 TRINITY_DN2807_c0_g2~~TRINITY_DN2807_c0_g2_i13.p1  ORF type:complete len:278 (-),score=-16.47 TRINITY_DN2807_c0_g2_i13:37-870(-)
MFLSKKLKVRENVLQPYSVSWQMVKNCLRYSFSKVKEKQKEQTHMANCIQKCKQRHGVTGICLIIGSGDAGWERSNQIYLFKHGRALSGAIKIEYFIGIYPSWIDRSRPATGCVCKQALQKQSKRDMEQLGQQTGKAKKKQQIVELCTQAWETVKKETIIKSFECTGIVQELSAESSLCTRLESPSTLHSYLKNSIEEIKNNKNCCNSTETDLSVHEKKAEIDQRREAGRIKSQADHIRRILRRKKNKISAPYQLIWTIRFYQVTMLSYFAVYDTPN